MLIKPGATVATQLLLWYPARGHVDPTGTREIRCYVRWQHAEVATRRCSRLRIVWILRELWKNLVGIFHRVPDACVTRCFSFSLTSLRCPENAPLWFILLRTKYNKIIRTLNCSRGVVNISITIQWSGSCGENQKPCRDCRWAPYVSLVSRKTAHYTPAD